jgi:phosphoglycerate dehydrogenase-like enzyme
MPRGEWLAGVRPALADRQVLLVGAGRIASAIADRLAPFEVGVTRVGTYARDDDRGHVHANEELPELLPRHEVVVLVCPLTDQTRGMVDAAFLAALPDGALVVNVARGAVVVTDALLAEVSSGRLRAALDVTDPEPLPPEHPLWRAPNVLISPHVGGATSAFPPRARALLKEQLERFGAGRPLLNVVNP